MRSAQLTTSGSTRGLPRDAADDNYNAFDPFPIPTTAVPRNGEVDDSDSYDGAGALILPVDRMRRFVTPADINGTGQCPALVQRQDYW